MLRQSSKSMPRLLFISNGSGLGVALSGGARRLIEMISALQGKGFDITLITTRGFETNVEHLKSNGLKVETVRCSVFWSELSETPYLRALGYVLATINTMARARRYRDYVGIYIGSDYFCDVVPAITFKLLHSIKLVSMIHHKAAPPDSRSGRFFLNLMSFWMQTFSYKALRRFADLITVYETEMGRSIADFFHGKLPVMFVKNGIDDSLGLASPKEYDLISVGGLRDSKGTLTSIKLCARIKARMPDVKMVLIGAGTVDYMKTVREAINNLGLRENVTILGHLDQENVYTFLSGSRFFVTCSQEEGWGIAVHEALINRVPVVGFDLPAFDQISEFCTLVPQGDISALCDTFWSEYSDYGNAEQLGRIEQGYRYASKLTWCRVLEPEIEAIEAIFDATL